MLNSVQPVLALGMPGPMEWIIIGIIGVLIFGKRLPSVGKSLGQGLVEFKKGLKGVQDEMDEVSSSAKQLDTPAPDTSVNTSENKTESHSA